MPESREFVTPADLRDTLRGMAVVQLLFRPQFNDTWFRLEPDGATAVAGWNDFAGNRCHFLLSSVGNVLLGFDHESPMSPHATCTGADDFRPWPGVYDSLPEPLAVALRENPFEDTFDYREVTVCLWNETRGKVWQKGEIEYPDRNYGDPDGESYLLGRLRGYVDDFCAEFADVYQWELDERAVAELLSGDDITPECLTTLRPCCPVADLIPPLEAMGYLFS